MEIRVLKYFLMVAREENITKAANLLHLTQPTLSRQLMQLEEELGVSLFRRSRHRIILTEDGMLLRRRAEEIVSLADKTKDDFQHRQEQLAGTIAVGSGEMQLAIEPQCPPEIYHVFREPLICSCTRIFTDSTDKISNYFSVSRESILCHKDHNICIRKFC